MNNQAFSLCIGALVAVLATGCGSSGSSSSSGSTSTTAAAAAAASGSTSGSASTAAAAGSSGTTATTSHTTASGTTATGSTSTATGSSGTGGPTTTATATSSSSSGAATGSTGSIAFTPNAQVALPLNGYPDGGYSSQELGVELVITSASVTDTCQGLAQAMSTATVDQEVQLILIDPTGPVTAGTTFPLILPFDLTSKGFPDGGYFTHPVGAVLIGYGDGGAEGASVSGTATLTTDDGTTVAGSFTAQMVNQESQPLGAFSQTFSAPFCPAFATP